MLVIGQPCLSVTTLIGRTGALLQSQWVNIAPDAVKLSAKKGRMVLFSHAHSYGSSWVVHWCNSGVGTEGRPGSRALRVLCYSPRLLQFHQNVVKGAGGLPDELLYGRMGFLYSLVFVNQQLGQDRIPLQYIQQVRPCTKTLNVSLSRTESACL